MAIRYSCVFTVKLTKSLNIHRTVLSNINDRSSCYLAMVGQRMISKCVITPNLKLNSVTPLAFETNPDSLPILKSAASRPLVVLLEYLNAKERHIRRFIDFYMDYGFDVLQIHLKPWQLLWPTKGSQIVAKDVAQFLAINESFSPMVIHGFSVGGYLWGEVVVHFSKNLALYQPVADRIRCKIFDSAVDVDEIPKGFPQAVFPKNPMLKSTFEKYLRYHLKTFYEESTKHYYASRKEFSGGIIKCPTLMITSDSDPLSTVEVNEKVRQELAAYNLEVSAFILFVTPTTRGYAGEVFLGSTQKCFIKVFEGSTHVAHFKKHKNDYIAEIESLFLKVNITQPQKLKAKL